MVHPSHNPALSFNAVGSEVHSMDNQFALLICHSILVGDHVSVQNITTDPCCMERLPRAILGLQLQVTTPFSDDKCKLREFRRRLGIRNTVFSILIHGSSILLNS